MWVKIVLDAVGGLLISAAVLLWIWLWEVFQDGEPWYLMANVTSIAFIASIIFIIAGVYLLRRKEIKPSLDGAIEQMFPSSDGSSTFGDEMPTSVEKTAAATDGKTGIDNAGRETAPHQALRTPQEAGGEGMVQSIGEDADSSPYVILGVHETDTLEMIREVFARLEAAYHPERYPDANEYSKAQKAARMLKIRSAYEWICAHHVARHTPPDGQADARGYYRQACELVNTRQYEAAVQMALKSIALDPADASAFSLLATAYANLSSYREAVNAFTRAIELGANTARTFNQRGFSYAQAGHDERAVEDFDRAIKLDPRFADAYNNRGIVHKKMGRHRRAIEDFTSAIQLDPNFAEAHTMRGLTYGELGGNQSKIDDFKAAARLGSAFAQQYLNEKGVEW